jgi:adenine-specific DNA-methyltransferase
MVYAIQNPFTGELLYPTMSSHWRYGQEEMFSIMNGWCPYELREIDDAEKRAAICGVSVDEVRKGVKAIMLSQPLDESKKSAMVILKRGQWPKFYFGSDGKGKIARKTYLDSVGGIAPQNLWLHQDVGHTDEAKKEVLKVFDGQSPFATPKPERLIKRVLEIATDEGDLVLDSFLGSGTAAGSATTSLAGRSWTRKGSFPSRYHTMFLRHISGGRRRGRRGTQARALKEPFSAFMTAQRMRFCIMVFCMTGTSTAGMC